MSMGMSTSPSTEDSKRNSMTNSELMEENELLRVQVQILQSTLREKLDEKEAKRADAQLATLEGEFLSTPSSWRSDTAAKDTENTTVDEKENTVHKMNPAASTDEHQVSHDTSGISSGQQTLDHAINLSMQLAESRAVVDALQGQLQQALLKNARLEEQLKKDATSKPEAIVCSQRDVSHHSRRSSLGGTGSAAGSFRSWFGGSSQLEVDNPEAEIKPRERRQSNDSLETELTFVSAEFSTNDTPQEADKENREDLTPEVTIEIQQV